MNQTLRWQHAAPGVRAPVEAWWYDPSTIQVAVEPIAENAHRRVVRLVNSDANHLVKHYRTGTGPHWLRERAKSALAISPCQREWRGLARLRRAGVPAPRPLGLARSANGDALLVMEAIEGRTLLDLLRDGPHDRRGLLLGVADAVAALHCAGLAHGDLHPGNLLIGHDGPVLVDLQRCRRARPRGRRQLRDLGLLDYSLRQLDVSRTDRLRVLRRILSRTSRSQIVTRAHLRTAIHAAERASVRQTRTRARRGRPPAPGSHWTL